MMVDVFSYYKKFGKMMKEGFSIDGWLSPLEALTLYLFCKNAKKTVEIGTFKGRSTYFLAKAVQEVNGNRVVTIDHHQGNEEHQNKENMPKGGTWDIFVKNMQDRGLFAWIMPIKKSSVEAAKSYDEKIDLLFIDGSHKYEDVQQDWESWSPKLVDGGIVIFHDCNWSGVSQVVNPLKEKYPFFRLESMMVFKKMEVKNGKQRKVN